MNTPSMMRAQWRAVGALGALGLIFTSLSTIPAVAAGDTTVYEPNGPAHCIVGYDNEGYAITQPGSCAQYGKAGPGRTNAKARNVILVIGDGMGQQEITAARNYLEGAGGRFKGIDNLPSVGLYTHYSIASNGTIEYVTDSAASGTAWATGTKTYNGALGLNTNWQAVPNLIEVAKNAGLRTGNVTTSDIQDATPGAIGAHVSTRSCYAPSGSKSNCGWDQRINGGIGSISEQLIDTRADVTLGGGSAYFNSLVRVDSGNTNPFLEGEAKFSTEWKKDISVLDNAKNNGYQVVTTAEELSAVTSANQAQPLLGLFHKGNMTPRFKSSVATLQGGQAEPMTCERQDIGTQPEVADMTAKAIELLNDTSSDKGFFLQVESASIDKRNHAADACGQIGETARLDEVVQTALDFAKRDGNTMVIVTADHSHTSQIVSDNTDMVAPATRLVTADGANMTIAHGTTTVKDGRPAGSQQHTGAQLRVAAFGPGSENVIGQSDQTDLFYTIINALNLNPEASSSNSDAALAQALPVDTAGAPSCFAVGADGVVASAPGACAQYGANGPGRSGDKAKNVILFIGDGMGDSEITSARNYLYGAGGRLPGLDALPYTGSYTHFSLKNDNGAIKPNYVTDSAASATAWATGTKTYNGAVAVDLAGRALPHLVELAKKQGLRTGNVTTSEVQDATPAAIAAHVSTRSCYAPSGDYKANCPNDQRINGGFGSISEQMVDTRADVTLGGGARAFDAQVLASGVSTDSEGVKRQWDEGRTIRETAISHGYQVVTNQSELDAVTVANQDSPVLGLFASSNMPRHFTGTTPDEVSPKNKTAERCALNAERTEELPDLADMTRKALDLLSADNDKGFFLQVEGASIDKADHDNDACGQIGELDDLDRAIQVAREWVRNSGEPTLIVATADHAHTSQITGTGTLTSGRNTKLLTADGSPMVLSYQTYGDSSRPGGNGHTGAQLRIAAEGPGAANVVGQSDQSDLFYTIANVLSLDTSPSSVVNPFELGAVLPPPSVTVNNSTNVSVEQGATVTFTASDFRAGEQVTFTVHSQPVEAGVARADRTGRATLEWVVPADFEVGEHGVVARGDKGSTAETTFRVTKAPEKPKPNEDTPQSDPRDNTGHDDPVNQGAGGEDRGKISGGKGNSEHKDVAEGKRSTGKGRKNLASTGMNALIPLMAGGVLVAGISGVHLARRKDRAA